MQLMSLCLICETKNRPVIIPKAIYNGMLTLMNMMECFY